MGSRETDYYEAGEPPLFAKQIARMIDAGMNTSPSVPLGSDMYDLVCPLKTPDDRFMCDW